MYFIILQFIYALQIIHYKCVITKIFEYMTWQVLIEITLNYILVHLKCYQYIQQGPLTIFMRLVIMR